MKGIRSLEQGLIVLELVILFGEVNDSSSAPAIGKHTTAREQLVHDFPRRRVNARLHDYFYPQEIIVQSLTGVLKWSYDYTF